MIVCTSPQYSFAGCNIIPTFSLNIVHVPCALNAYLCAFPCSASIPVGISIAMHKEEENTSCEWSLSINNNGIP